MVSIRTIWPSEQNEKVFLFPRNLQYPARLKGPLSVFVGILRLFSEKNEFSPKSPPFNFLTFCNNG